MNREKEQGFLMNRKNEPGFSLNNLPLRAGQPMNARLRACQPSSGAGQPNWRSLVNNRNGMKFEMSPHVCMSL
jgi:hypothetical protein